MILLINVHFLIYYKANKNYILRKNTITSYVFNSSIVLIFLRFILPII